MKSKYITISFIIFSILSVLISFYFRLDITGGLSPDHDTHWIFIEKIRLYPISEFLNIHVAGKSPDGIDSRVLHFPLHHMIVAKIFFFLNEEEFLFYYFIFSLSFPVLFYKILKIRFPDLSNLNLIALSSIILILPNFQSSAIWGNSHISSLICFLISLHFFEKFYNQSEKNELLYLVLFSFFLVCASYIRQYYVVFSIFYFYRIVKDKSFKVMIYYIFINLIFSIPGFIFIINNPGVISSLSNNITNFYSATLISFSIVSFYILPFFITYFIKNKNKFYDEFTYKNIAIFLLFFLIISFCIMKFTYSGNIGGGIFLKINNLFFDNFYLFYFICYLMIIPITIFFFNRPENIIIFLIICCTFTSGFFVFQKYFEPMVLIIIVMLTDKEFIRKIIMENVNLIYIYFIIYNLSYFAYSLKLF